MSAADFDQIWGQGNWVTHECSVNLEMPHVATHSKAYHRVGWRPGGPRGVLRAAPDPEAGRNDG